MAITPKTPRPKIYPPPEFPPKQLPLFARMPPAVFPSMLGLLGLGLALKRASFVAEVPEALADLVMGLVAGLWLFCAVAYGIKLARRPAVLLEELQVLPGRAGVAAATVGAMALAGVLGFFAPALAKSVLVLALILHSLSALLMVRVLMLAPPEGRVVTPVWHLSFVGFIVGALAAAPLGWTGLAAVILWGTIPIALAIWAISLWQILRRVPPAPLRPLLAIHLAPASLFASVAGLLGQGILAQAMVLIGAVIAIALLVSARWIVEAGFTPLWGAFTFPMAAYASALLINGWVMGGVLVTVLALGAVPVIAWRVLRMWTAGSLAAKTNAATA